jgi:glycosyltransferase involved in cell wall biosynthesis
MAGGAERFTLGLARGLVAQGDEVEWFSASFPGAADREDLDGIRIVRAGRQWTVHLNAIRHYRKTLGERFDVVIDEVNTIPFFTPLWSSVPSYMLIHQLAQEVWWYESRFPLNAVGYVLEPLYLRLYRHRPAFTVSDSTRKDLLKYGFSGPITIVPEGLESGAPGTAPKSGVPTCIYVGRIAPSKRVADVIRAFSRFRQDIKTAQLWVVGDGPERYRRQLARLVERLGLTRDVHFFGHLSNQEKQEKMARAHMLLMTSVREGWGLVVSECAALGTPTVAYDVPGLRDSVVHGRTGLLTEESPADLSLAMSRLWADPELYEQLVRGGLQAVRDLSFDRATAIVRDRLLGSPETGLEPLLVAPPSPKSG